MKIAIEDGVLIIEMPVNDPLTLSNSEKSLVVATSNGPVQTETLVDGRPLFVGINAYVSNPNYVKKPKG